MLHARSALGPARWRDRCGCGDRVSVELGARPGRPRDVGARGPCTWFLDHEDGTVSFVVRRTAPSGVRHGVELAFCAATDAEATAEYDAWSTEEGEKNIRLSKRMEKWGPLGQGKMV